MKNLERGSIKLWIVYQENGILVSGLTDLTVDVKYSDGTSIIAGQALSESPSGTYSYQWDASSIDLDKIVFVYFKKGSDILDVEEYYFQALEDADAQAL